MPRKKFPNEIFVRWEDEGDNAFLTADPKVEGHAEVGETRQVAVYELKRVGNLTTKVEHEFK